MDTLHCSFSSESHLFVQLAIWLTDNQDRMQQLRQRWCYDFYLRNDWEIIKRWCSGYVKNDVMTFIFVEIIKRGCSSYVRDAVMTFIFLITHRLWSRHRPQMLAAGKCSSATEGYHPHILISSYPNIAPLHILISSESSYPHILISPYHYTLPEHGEQD